MRPRTRGLAAETVPEILALPEEEIDIGRAALLVAREDRPGLDVDAYIRRLDEDARRLSRRLPAGTPAAEAVRQTISLVQPRSRSGRPDPSVRASAVSAEGLPPEIDLARILDGGEGNCLGVTLLYLAVAERAGVPLYGVSAPEHFFVRYDDGVTRVNIETTRGGRTVPDRTYRGRVSRDSIDRGIHLRSESKRQVIASLLANRAGYRAMQGRLVEAERDALRALAVKPYWPQGYVNRGLVHELSGRTREAVSDYRRALKLDPHCVGALNNLAALYSRGRDAGQHPEVPTLRGSGGEAVPGSLETAEWMIRRAMKFAPRRAELYATAAAVASARGRFRQARARLAHARSLDPDDERYAEALRRLDLRMHRSEEGAAPVERGPS